VIPCWWARSITFGGTLGVHHYVRHSLEQHAQQPEGARDVAGRERREDDAVGSDAGQARAQLREQGGVGVPPRRCRSVR
jgi:hypothetical protein